MLARDLLRLRGAVHLHFHDWELLDRRRALALDALLRVLRRRRQPVSVEELAERAAAAPELGWDEARLGSTVE
jgi:hypothetical protein